MSEAENFTDVRSKRVQADIKFDENIVMKLQSEKLKLIEWLATLEDKATIEKLKFIKENPSLTTDWWDSITDAEKLSIDRGLRDIKNGKTTPHATARKKYEKWL